MKNVQPVIMAGGFGTRLWPMSGKTRQKQFLKIFSGKSLFQLTLLRNMHLGRPVAIVNITQKEIACAQIKEIGYEADIVVEPIQKNTAPCAIIASIYAKNRNKDKVALFPSDHYVDDHTQYKISINQALVALRKHKICTIGIKPSAPSTGYGYIHVQGEHKDSVRTTKGFVEKPSLDLAKQFLKQANYFWNPGMFFYDANFMLNMSNKFIPEVLQMVKNSERNSIQEKPLTLLAKEPYANISPISLDRSIIQNIKKMAFIEARFDWKDVGSWDSVDKMSKKDHNLNHLEGNVLAMEVTNSFIKSDGPKTAVVGLSDVIVINSGGTVLVVSKGKSEAVKEIESKMDSSDLCEDNQN